LASVNIKKNSAHTSDIFASKEYFHYVGNMGMFPGTAHHYIISDIDTGKHSGIYPAISIVGKKL
jgi:hypothetical protein